MTTARPARFVARAAKVPDDGTPPAGVCPEALAQLAGYRLPDRTVDALRRMVRSRQLAAARVMAGENNCSGDLARALLAATAASQRVDDPRGRRSGRERARRLAGMEKGLVRMQTTVSSLAPGYHDDLYCLALTASFVRGWMRDDVVRTWLRSHCPGNAVTLEKLVCASDAAAVPKRPMKLPYVAATREPDRKRR